MDSMEEIFYKAKPDETKLLAFGFTKLSNGYQLSESFDDDFDLRLLVNDDVKVELIDKITNEPYIAYLKGIGNYAASIKERLNERLLEIRDACFIALPFRSSQAMVLLDYVQSVYQIEPEFPWADDHDAAVLRNPSTGKWFGLIMTIPASRLGLDSETRIDVLNLKLNKKVSGLISTRGFYAAYHMNKKSWISLTLDDSVSNLHLFGYIDESYENVSK